MTLDHVRGHVSGQGRLRLDFDAEAAAVAILRIANDRMAGAVRLVSLSRGHDPRDFALFAQQGPLHATALARELGIPTVLVPVRPGITNALGCVVADLRHDYVRTVNKPLSAVDDATVARIYAEQAAEGEATIAREGVPVRELRRVLSGRHAVPGQSHILSVGVDSADIGVAGLHKAFAAAYWRRFGIELPEILPVLVNLHTAVIGVRLENLARRAGRHRARADARRCEARHPPRLVQRRLARYAGLVFARSCRSTPRWRVRPSSNSSTAPPSSNRATRSGRTSSAIC